jgi:hypothetical protein
VCVICLSGSGVSAHLAVVVGLSLECFSLPAGHPLEDLGDGGRVVGVGGAQIVALVIVLAQDGPLVKLGHPALLLALVKADPNDMAIDNANVALDVGLGDLSAWLVVLLYFVAGSAGVSGALRRRMSTSRSPRASASSSVQGLHSFIKEPLDSGRDWLSAFFSVFGISGLLNSSIG